MRVDVYPDAGRINITDITQVFTRRKSIIAELLRYSVILLMSFRWLFDGGGKCHGQPIKIIVNDNVYLNSLNPYEHNTYPLNFTS